MINESGKEKGKKLHDLFSVCELFFLQSLIFGEILDHVSV